MQFVMATNNLKKRDEMERILKELGIEVLTTQSRPAPTCDVEESWNHFRGKSQRLKAKAALDLTGKAAVADDSGLMVDALDGAPGVYSARYGGPDATDRGKSTGELLKEHRKCAPGKADRQVCFRHLLFISDGQEIMGGESALGKSLTLLLGTAGLAMTRSLWWKAERPSLN